MASDKNDPPPTNTALCIGHPGHELRVLHWVYLSKPLTSILTDGSGPDRESRVASTQKILDDAGARPGAMYGRYPDREVYKLIRAKDPTPFIGIADELAAEWDGAGIELVAGDMIEGFNTGHDVCRMMINAAVDRLRTQGKREIGNFEFPLERLSSPCPPEGSIVVRLSDKEFERKHTTAKELYPEVAEDVTRTIEKYGTEPFKTETLTPACSEAGLTWDDDEPPFYERYGARQVEAGHYDDLITFKDHMQPIAQALYEWSH